jgi:hypothetical protein
MPQVADEVAPSASGADGEAGELVDKLNGHLP